MADVPAVRPSPTPSEVIALVEQALATPPPRPLTGRIADAVRYVFTGRTQWMSPGEPLHVVAPAGTPPRQFEMPISVNRQMVPRGTEAIGFREMRALADNATPLRGCIETVKDLHERFSPEVAAKDEKPTAEAKAHVQVVADFLAAPDGIHTLRRWIRMLLEDVLVPDAACSRIHRTRGGEPWRWEIFDGTCYSDDTEVLTRRGWLRFAETTADDEFATRNQETKAFAWQRSTYVHVADYVGPMHRFHSRAVDLLVTPNHRMLVTSLPRRLGGVSHRARGDVVVRAADLAGAHTSAQRIPMTSCWTGERIEARTFRSADVRSRPLAMTGDAYAAFMGMWLAEGCVSATGRPKRDAIYVSQMPASRGFAPYAKLLRRILGRDCGHTGTAFHFKSQGLSDHLRQFGHARDKFIPEDVMNAPVEQLAVFWRYFWLGDGAADRNRLFTSSPRLADQLVEIAQKLGWSASVRARAPVAKMMANGRAIAAEDCAVSYVISVRQSAAMTFGVSTEQYAGKVRCVSVPNEFLYVRRNGKPAWCGNTIKPLLDATGRQPIAGPAYEQIVYGAKSCEFEATELVYMPRNPRPHKIYGYSPVEQVILVGNIAINRELSQLAYFTDGNIPDVFIKAPKEWTPDQLRQAQLWWAQMKGDLAARRGVTVVPEGGIQEYRQPPLKDEFDEWIWSVATYFFGLTRFHFSKGGSNKATAQVMQDASINEGLIPRQLFLTEFVERLIFLSWGFTDVTLKWQETRDPDPEVQAKIEASDVTHGIRTVNEIRTEKGLDSVEGGDEPFLVAGQTVILLKDVAAGKYTPLDPAEQAKADADRAATLRGGDPNANGDSAPTTSGKTDEAPPKPGAKAKPTAAAPSAKLDKAVRGRTIDTVPKGKRRFWQAERAPLPPRARPNADLRGES